MLQADVKVNRGSVTSNEAQFQFFKLAGLDRAITYVLPVTVDCRDMEMLRSAKNYYFVFRAGALINVVADMSKNYLTVKWKTPDLVTNMRQITMEALIYPREFGKLISTVMGIEGNFLMRIGDAGFPDNQIQIATGSGNFPDADSNKGLQTNRWQHVAMTYDADKEEVKVYVDGRLQSRGTLRCGSVTIKGNGRCAFGTWCARRRKSPPASTASIPSRKAWWATGRWTTTRVRTSSRTPPETATTPRPTIRFRGTTCRCPRRNNPLTQST